jgi:hypothetical protein
LGAGLIGKTVILCSGRNRSRSRGLAGVRIVFLLALIALAVSARSQQATLSAPAQATDATLPAASDVQASATQQVPAETLPGSVHGIVMDRDGTVCEGAQVSLALMDASQLSVRTVISDSGGGYYFGGVPVGAFKLTIFSEGFVTQVISGLLHSGESYQALPVKLLLIATQSQVEVTATEQEIAQEQVREEEQQRVLGFIPNFYVSYVPNPSPLTSRQKYHIAWMSSIDPITLLSTGIFAGIEQTDDSFSGYGQGTEGYAKRYGANYADNFIGTMIGAAMLPSLLKQDPRYFYKGSGSKSSRVFYAMAMSVVCKGDKGRWQANYSGLLGGFASGGISNLYYPAASRNGVSLTFENFGIGIAEGAVENIFQEFVVRKLTPKLPQFASSQP